MSETLQQICAVSQVRKTNINGIFAKTIDKYGQALRDTQYCLEYVLCQRFMWSKITFRFYLLFLHYHIYGVCFGYQMKRTAVAPVCTRLSKPCANIWPVKNEKLIVYNLPGKYVKKH